MKFYDNNWNHGIQLRNTLSTDTQRVRELIKEDIEIKVSLLDKAISLEDSLNTKDQDTRYKIRIIDGVVLSMFSTTKEEKQRGEQIILTTLSKYPNLSSWCSHVRQELSK